MYIQKLAASFVTKLVRAIYVDFPLSLSECVIMRNARKILVYPFNMVFIVQM